MMLINLYCIVNVKYLENEFSAIEFVLALNKAHSTPLSFWDASALAELLAHCTSWINGLF